jgi:uncharacterized protein
VISPQPEPRALQIGSEFSDEQRRFLLSVAREAISACVAAQVFEPQTPWPELAGPRAVFTTLYSSEGLRGCVGHVPAAEPLTEAVARTAVSAAFSDPRFPPLTADELPAVRIQLSVLSLLFPISPEQIEIGRHGLYVRMGARRGLLLPQIPLEFGWDREMFLAQTCHKAGLPGNAWMDAAELLGFTTESFGE